MITNAILCFQRPKEGGYIGGLVTLCNDYISKSKLFNIEGVSIDCFNYELQDNSIINKLNNSKIKNLAYGFLQIRALRKFLKNHSDTVIHIHTSRKALFFKDVLLAFFIRKRSKMKTVMTIHVGDIGTVFHNGCTKSFLIKLINKCIDKVIFLSQNMQQQFIDAGLNPERSCVLYNFYNIKRLSPSEKRNNKTPRLIYLGSINKEKGIIELLTALNQIRLDFELDVCGTIIEPAITHDFNNLMKSLGNKATYHGYINKIEKEELLKNADILILPSYREGMPISILEAMATSCGIITTPVGAIPEILNNNNAELIPPRDVLALKVAIERLLTNIDRLNSMKSINYKESDKYDDKHHISSLCALYK